MRINSAVGLVGCAIAGLLVLGACSGGSDEQPASVPVSAAVGVESEAAAVSDDTADPGESDEFSDAWLATAAKQFAKTQDPEPTVRVTSETAAEFTFSAGSADGADALSDCQIAMGAIGMEYDLTMIYPDGVVRCADLLS